MTPGVAIYQYSGTGSGLVSMASSTTVPTGKTRIIQSVKAKNKNTSSVYLKLIRVTTGGTVNVEEDEWPLQPSSSCWWNGPMNQVEDDFLQIYIGGNGAGQSLSFDIIVDYLEG